MANTRRTRAKAGGFGNTANPVLRRERQEKALRLRRAGYTIREIFERCPEYPNEKALRADLRKTLKKMIDLPAQELLALQYHRFEVLIRSIWKEAVAGDLQVHDRILKLIVEQGKLMKMGDKMAGEGDGSDVERFINSLISDASEADAEDLEDEGDG